ncbi:hypothetical protein [Paenibacillus donghaensis]|nr:hypothetical protein [Paenibacillus donghaensis]
MQRNINEQPDQLSVSMCNILDAIMSDKPLPPKEEYLHLHLDEINV